MRSWRVAEIPLRGRRRMGYCANSPTLLGKRAVALNTQHMRVSAHERSDVHPMRFTVLQNPGELRRKGSVDAY
jgi:hypothetical protein